MPVFNFFMGNKGQYYKDLPLFVNLKLRKEKDFIYAELKCYISLDFLEIGESVSESSIIMGKQMSSPKILYFCIDI